MTTHTYNTDVAIIGGGVIGSATAYFLKLLSPSLAVTVLEPDPTYEFCSTLRASGGARHLFSCPENIEMSKFSIDFIKAFPQAMAMGDRPAPVDWVEGGYLFIVPPEGMGLLESNYAIQREHGCDVHLLTPRELKDHFPSMYVDDLAGGVLSPRDGWCDPNGLLQGFKRKAVSMGVVYLKDRVTSLFHSGASLTHAGLQSGATISASAFVNAAGAWAGDVSALAGVPLPVSPLRRFEHYFTCGNPMEKLPYVKDLARMAFRSEGVGFSGGLVNGDEPRGFNFDVDHDYFERVVWPAAAHRFPPLESAKCHRTWSGLYEVCELDGNPIIGATSIGNFYAVAGFSGHGMMHAPAAGRGIAELIVRGQFETIDLARLGYERVVSGEPYREAGIL
ncbi:MAG: FAD-binding oxidoreductase [Betaproteobacteria bacterium]|nr:FAD-binding oxidoreductase [Betaproteobacteria bacterium]